MKLKNCMIDKIRARIFPFQFRTQFFSGFHHFLQLLEKDASKRLGNRFCPHGDIQDHVFFKPIDWPALEARALESPFKPNLVSELR